MPQFILKITLGNDAMQTGNNVCRALCDVSYVMEDYGYLLNPEMKKELGKIRDLNGNLVGTFEVI